jgi:hypothetical protein
MKDKRTTLPMYPLPVPTFILVAFGNGNDCVPGQWINGDTIHLITYSSYSMVVIVVNDIDYKIIVYQYMFTCFGWKELLSNLFYILF